MLKRFGLSVMALAAALVVFAPRPAKAADVRFGVSIGAPAYSYPVPADPYVDPYYGSPYDYPQYYAAPQYYYPAPVYGPTYVTPYYRGHDRHEWREHYEHRGHESREHGRGHGRR